MNTGRPCGIAIGDAVHVQHIRRARVCHGFLPHMGREVLILYAWANVDKLGDPVLDTAAKVEMVW